MQKMTSFMSHNGGLQRPSVDVDSACRFCSRKRPQEPWDEVLTSSPSFFAVPTKGAIVAPWVLVVPRRHVLSTAELLPAERLEFSRFVAAVAAKLGKRVIYFEHGPIRPKTPIGCGVDHAHLHLVVFDGNFANSVRSLMPSLKWEHAGAPWENESLRGRSYFAFSDDGDTWSACVEPPPVRQFFRQVIASSLGCPDRFDYEAHPQPENALQTRLLWAPNK